ncbi:MAG: hypothetical protein B7Y25_01930 [Alphaproteobacteria bacterium 16-39-46]|nr:MAG: hypothetical protein B7Y25_01930 [Alphaproteobacteria bacterium 16-39-46]OZA43737.1 MAG: hypothetical protein B7X84_02180 [Alphaproteobacteria bacterium 17-39-52]HQS83553.1 GNAT family N-acetyltransferase [Alphaproteobacteria bacterium]HQS93348.1 GNAT family N-acetyltransferase [Alphaproteobacteria bacterium]
MIKTENNPSSKSVLISPYAPHWPQMFEKESSLIKQALGKNCISIHHIGSTSIPNLAAKPIIDMVPVVLDIKRVDTVTKKIEALGYTAQGEYGMPFRRYFQKGTGVEGYHVHIFEDGNPEIDRHLRFRDWMRIHKDDREAYEALKKNLARQFPNDRMAYCFGKVSFIEGITKKSGFDGCRILIALTEQEWEAYHRIREKQIFEPISVPYDRHHPSLSQKNHFHFVLYKGSTIVSVAHIEFLNRTEAALRSLATDESYKKQGYGSHMVKLLEKWIKHQGRSFLKMHARLSSENFYRRLGYIEMPFEDPCIQKEYVNLGKVL